MINNQYDYFNSILKECNLKGKLLIINYLSVSFVKNPSVRFLFLLRTCEYYGNCKKGFFNRFVYFVVKTVKFRLGIRLGFSIPENVFDIGLQLPHYGTIVINANAKVGKNCRLHVCTNIGTSNKSSLGPVLGDNVYIGPGVKIYGQIKVTNNIKIAPNSAVSKNFLEEYTIIGGVPATIIGRYTNSKGQ